jgi:hypothetical protein
MRELLEGENKPSIHDNPKRQGDKTYKMVVADFRSDLPYIKIHSFDGTTSMVKRKNCVFLPISEKITYTYNYLRLPQSYFCQYILGENS